MKTILKSLSVCVLVSVLAACGGGSSSSGQVPTPSLIDSVATPESYNGLREPVLLAAGNTLDFARVLFGVSALDELNTLPAQPSDLSGRGSHPGFMGVMRLLDRFASPSGAIRHSQRVVTQSCLNQGVGTISIDDRLYTSLGRSALIYQFNNCQMDDAGNLATGQVVLVSEPDSTVAGVTSRKRRVDIRDLRISGANESHSYTGSQRYEIVDRGYDASLDMVNSSWSAETNLSERDVNNGRVNLISNLKRSLFTYQASTIEGYLFDHALGYVKLMGSDDLRLTNDEDLLQEGQILLRGASNSVAAIRRMQQTQNGMAYTVALDQDGDGQYEAAALTNPEVENGTDFSSDLAPRAVITNDGSAPQLGDSVLLHAGRSTDFDSAFMTLRFEWTLEEKPAGSMATLSIDPVTQSDTAELHLDKAGEYKISLKVTDPEGHSGLAVENIVIADQPPQVDFGIFEDNLHIELGDQSYLHLSIYDNEDNWEQVQEYPYVWTVQVPANSNAYLEDAHRESAHLTPDVPGTYTVSYQTTDSAGNTVTETLALQAANTPPVALIDMSATVGNGGVVFGSTVELSGIASHDLGSGGYDLQYAWNVVSAPAGSQAQITDERIIYDDGTQLNAEYAQFVPDAVGDYRLSLTVTDKFGAVDTVYKDFTVIAR